MDIWILAEEDNGLGDKCVNASFRQGERNCSLCISALCNDENGLQNRKPLLFNENELDAEAVMSMMAVGGSESAPLYMHRVLVSLTAILCLKTWANLHTGHEVDHARLGRKLHIH